MWDDYGPGGHTWPYWRRDLRRTLPILMETFAHPTAPPRAVSYRSMEPSFAIFGWRVALARPALEFSALARADRRGFVLRGSGRATVTTPALYPRGAERWRRSRHTARDAPPGSSRPPRREDSPSS